MDASLTSVPNPQHCLANVSVVVHLSDINFLNEDRLERLASHSNGVTVAIEQQRRPSSVPEHIHWHSFESGKVRSDVWNSLIGEADTKWVLFIEDDENIHFGSFPDEQNMESDVWIPTLLKWDRGSESRQFYKMRLVDAETAGLQRIFDGQNLPDCTTYIRDNGIEMSDRSIIVDRSSNPLEHIDIDEELSVRNAAPKLYLVQGERCLENNKYVRAAAQYRKLLKMDKLLPCDRLAAVNGLASCMTERHKWDKALDLAEKSLNAEPLQSLPYLIKFRIRELQKQWEKAFEVLLKYYQRLLIHSQANFDRYLSEEKSLVMLANTAYKAGERKQAVKYFEKFFSLKRDSIDHSLIKRVLVLSVQLGDYERSVYLFRKQYDDKLPNRLDENSRQELDDYMTMFMNQGWYEYVSEIYSRLYEAHPQNEVFKRRLIAALTKSNRMQEARSIVSNS